MRVAIFYHRIIGDPDSARDCLKLNLFRLNSSRFDSTGLLLEKPFGIFIVLGFTFFIARLAMALLWGGRSRLQYFRLIIHSTLQQVFSTKFVPKLKIVVRASPNFKM
jgi:hypothetical protein